MKRPSPPSSRRPDWPALAAALARRLPADALHERAMAAIVRRPADETIALACSGGADSVALVLALWAHLPERRGHWLILHFNHRLRGRAADGDARFVETLARGLGERCVAGAWKRGRAPAARRHVSEGDAREARWGFFSAEMARASAPVIALGHQRDDVAETMLMRLARGSGSGGLAAPRPVQRMIDGGVRVRPLLDLGAAEIRAALRAIGAPWREDASNAGDDFFRNRIRHRVLPALAKASPHDPAAALAAAREQLEDDDDALQAWLAELLPGAPVRGEPCEVRALAGRPRALARRAVQGWLAGEGLSESLGRAAAERLVAAASAADADENAAPGGGAGEGPAKDANPRGARVPPMRLSAGAGRFVVFDRGRLTVEHGPTRRLSVPAQGWPEAALRSGGDLRGPCGDRLKVRVRRLTPGLRTRILAGDFSPAETVFLDLGASGAAGLRVRSWQRGDRFRPLGAPGSKKLQDLFVDRRIRRELRLRLPVVCRSDGTLLWVPGIPPAAGAAVGPGSKLVVQLTYTGPGDIVPGSTSTHRYHA